MLEVVDPKPIGVARSLAKHARKAQFVEVAEWPYSIG
jgi:hypothetical protein